MAKHTQTIRRLLPTNCLSAFEHLMELLLKQAASKIWTCAKPVRGQACNFMKKETQAQLFSYEFCEIFKKTFFPEHLWTTASY